MSGDDPNIPNANNEERQSLLTPPQGSFNQISDPNTPPRNNTSRSPMCSTEIVQTPRRFPNKLRGREKQQQTSAGAQNIKAWTDHKIPLSELLSRLKTDKDRGLSSIVAERLNKEYGDNVLTAKESTPWYVKLLTEFVTPFAIVLWVGALLSFLAYFLDEQDVANVYVAFVLIALVLVSGTSAFLQNWKSEEIMEKFKNFIPLNTVVIRDGASKTIPAAKLVPGDIVKVKEGDKIPADVRVIFANEMKVDNSSLTGESDLMTRSADCTNEHNPLETENICFFGTFCKQGSCTGVVLKIGDNTFIGQIAHLTATAGAEKTPLQKEMDEFVILIAIISFSVGVIFFFLGFIMGYSALTNLIFAVGLITGNVPEGLLVFTTVLLTVCAKKLATKEILAKNLQGVETLGATTCICSDKTGTLTQNRMTVEHLWYDGTIIKAPNKQKFKDRALEYDENSPGFKALQEVAVISSVAEFDEALPRDQQDKLSRIDDMNERNEAERKAMEIWVRDLPKKMWLDRPVIGDASETALIKFFQPIEDVKTTRMAHPVIKVNNTEMRVPFNSTNKFALVIVEHPIEGSEYCILIKGAPERIWSFCTKILSMGQEPEIDDYWQSIYDQANLKFGKGGERVLGFAKLHLPSSDFPKGFDFKIDAQSKYPDFSKWNFPMKGMTFVGLISVVDPPRDGVSYSITKCKTAGIKVIMVTGDQPVTAAAIAKQVHILDSHTRTNLDLQEEFKFEDPDEAIMRADAIIIHGEQLSQAAAEDEKLPEEFKGLKLKYWLSKPQVVFARTSPAQKLIIVKNCQEIDHIVAVTGDGVNDSPAIKKADIGIAMGSGSNVATDAADLVLMSDDFSSIVVGIEEGRKLYDNLKKCISYTLTTNIPEIMPFIILIIFRLPLPVTTVFLLCLSLGTDMFPAISFAYEEPELDIMVVKPRDRTDTLVTKRMLVFTYMQIGMFETFAAFLTYFTIMADFGFLMHSLVGMGTKVGYQPYPGDYYDPYMPGLGNTRLVDACDPVAGKDHLKAGDIPTYQPDWVYNRDDTTDFRMVFVQCQYDDGVLTGGVQSTVQFGPCRIKQISSVTDCPICYTTEALKYAQMGYFVTVVMCQWSNVLINKTRRVSVYYHGLNNYAMLWGLASETIICFVLAYWPFLHLIMGTRDVTFYHFGLPGLPFSLLILLYDEMRKGIIDRNLKKQKKDEKPNWWVTHLAW